MKLHELYKRIDPKTDMLNSALAALHRRASSKGDLQSIDGYAFDIIRSYNIDIGAKELARLYREKHNIAEDEESVNEGYKLQLERDTDMMVLHIKDTATGKRTEVRGKPGYETNYDPNDSLHILLDKVGKSANISELMNGEVVTINPKHPDADRAKAATDVAFTEEVEVSLHGDAKKGYVLSKIEVSGDERNAGQGTKAMQAIVDRMDREGAVIALTPDDAYGGNKNRLIKFYKRFGFVPNKGRNKDFRFRETMIRYPQSNESVTEVSKKEEFDAIRNGYVDIEFDKKWWPLSSDYPLIKHIGEAIGATSWTSWGKVGVPWSGTEMIGGGGTYMLKGDFGHILLDASKTYRPDGITMAQISTSNRGDGVGAKVMNAIKQYADKQKLPFTVYKVTNVPFFKKFSWLTQTDAGTFVYDPTKKVQEATVTEALDNPYPVRWSIQDDDEWEGKAKTEAGDSIQIMITQGFNNHKWEVDFYVGGSMQVTGKGDQFRVFATVVSAVKKWWSWLSKSKQPVEAISFSAFKGNKSAAGSTGRSSLYNRFATQFARSIGFTVSTVDSKDNIKFVLSNPILRAN